MRKPISTNANQNQQPISSHHLVLLESKALSNCLRPFNPSTHTHTPRVREMLQVTNVKDESEYRFRSKFVIPSYFKVPYDEKFMVQTYEF